MTKQPRFSRTKRSIFSLAALVAGSLICSSSFVSAVGLSESQIEALNSNVLYFNTCSGSSSAGGTSLVGTGTPDGAVFPNLDPSAMANAINKWIVMINSNSEMKGLGATIVADAQHSNINPFLIVAIAQHESGLADPGDYNVIHGSNAFGRTAAAGQPSFQGAKTWYYWTSVAASVDYTAPENLGKAYGGDMAAFLRSVYGTAIDANNLLAVMEAYAPPSDGNNTIEYVATIKQTIAQLITLTNGGSISNPNSSTSSTPVTPSSNYSCASSVVCNSPVSSSATDALRQHVLCIAEAELATWEAQPGYPWQGLNSYSETGYLKYSQGRAEEWCADFVSWVYDQAGYPIQPDPNWDLSAVAEIQAIGEQNQNFHWHPQSSGYSPQPGDIAIHTDDGHTNIVDSINGNTIVLIGGDQGDGPYPGGSIVSTETITNPYDGIIGYVSPD